MLRTPSRLPRVAAPRNKCRVPWQRREFTGPGGRKRPPPSSRLGEQNPVPLQGEQNGRKTTPGRGSGRLRDLGHLLSFRGMTLPVGGTRGSRSDRRSGQRCPPGGPRRRAQPASAAQRSGLHSWLPPLSPLRKPGGSYQPPGSLLLKPRRRDRTLKASTGD